MWWVRDSLYSGRWMGEWWLPHVHDICKYTLIPGISLSLHPWNLILKSIGWVQQCDYVSVQFNSISSLCLLLLLLPFASTCGECVCTLYMEVSRSANGWIRWYDYDNTQHSGATGCTWQSSIYLDFLLCSRAGGVGEGTAAAAESETVGSGKLFVCNSLLPVDPSQPLACAEHPGPTTRPPRWWSAYYLVGPRQRVIWE